MNFQEKVIKTTMDLRQRAAALANVAVATARARAQVAARRVETLKGSLTTLTVGGRQLNTLARRHAARFVKQNSTIAVDAGKDVGALARSTFASLTQRAQPKPKARKKVAATRRRAARAA
jgi:hypothetical protein